MLSLKIKSHILMLYKAIKQISLLAIISFILHLIWENAHAPLFVGYESFSQHFFYCFLATFGDVLFTLIVYWMIAILKNDFNWIKNINKNDYFVLAIFGIFFALGIEYRALLWERWQYSSLMPIIPYFKIGLTPILQMTLLLPLSFYLKNMKQKYQCTICKLYFKNKEWAQKCEDWCAQNKSCNLAITKKALKQSKDNLTK